MNESKTQQANTAGTLTREKQALIADIDRVQKTISHIEESLSELYDSLSPVLSPEYEAEVCPSEGNLSDDPKSPSRYVIQEVNSRLDIINIKIRDASNRALC